MPEGTFNVARLIAELGLKPVVGENALRVLNSIQPTMVVGEMAQVTPPHVAPTSLFGASEVIAPALFSTVAIQSLGEGGAFVDWMIHAPVAPTLMSVVTVDPGATTVLASAGQVSRDAVRSIARHDPVAAIATPSVFISGGATQLTHNFGPGPIFVPRGSFFALQAALANTSFTWGLNWREVPASEHVPS